MFIKLKFYEIYLGVEEVNGEEYYVESVEGFFGVFRVFLDVGLVRISIGVRVFGVFKGVVDGGMDILYRFVCSY